MTEPRVNEGIALAAWPSRLDGTLAPRCAAPYWLSQTRAPPSRGIRFGLRASPASSGVVGRAPWWMQATARTYL